MLEYVVGRSSARTRQATPKLRISATLREATACNLFRFMIFPRVE